MRVKPVIPGAIIRDPHSRIALPADGGEVPESSFWIRRLIAGEVIRVEESTAPIGFDPVTPLITRDME